MEDKVKIEMGLWVTGVLARGLDDTQTWTELLHYNAQLKLKLHRLC